MVKLKQHWGRLAVLASTILILGVLIFGQGFVLPGGECGVCNSIKLSDRYVFTIFIPVSIRMAGIGFHLTQLVLVLVGITEFVLLGIVPVFYLVLLELFNLTICPICTFLHLLIVANVCVVAFLKIRRLLDQGDKKDLPAPTGSDSRKKTDTCVCITPWIASILAVIWILFVVTVFTGVSRASLSPLVECLSIEKEVAIYGSHSCDTCNFQLLLFKNLWHDSCFVDCKATPEGEQMCQNHSITVFPTWLDKNGKRHEGPLDAWPLAQFFGCEDKVSPFWRPFLE